ncbi:MAG: hypothetical protein IJD57_06080 [Candidatus Gastranaerophilales bacterium]|nr:hypothetical protein [Candidatus Gastranaerophilales bacterium]
MKKRALLALIFAILVCLLTKKCWLYPKDLPFNFNIQGQGNCKFEVQFNKKNDIKFKKVKSFTLEKNLNKTNKFNLIATNVSNPKYFKIIIKQDNQNKITISDINFKNKKYKILDLDNFEISGAKSKIENNSIIISPEKPQVELVYKNKLNLGSNIKFQWEIFVIILILTFLFSYKINDYLADFSSIKHKSRIEIVFLALFFTILFIPMLSINQDRISEKENRKLAVWKPLIKKDCRLNFDFGKDFEKWFNDRFFLRDSAINLYKTIYFTFRDRNSKGVIDRKTNTLYMDLDFKHFDNSELSKKFENIFKFQTWCKNNNIKLYLLITPQKSDIYLTEANYYNSRNTLSDNIEFFNKLNEEDKISVIFPYDEMVSALKDNYMYFKTDHHWTDDGAFVGYKSLIKEMKKNYPSLEPLKSKDFNIFYNKKIRADFDRKFLFGWTSNLIGLSLSQKEKYHNIDYRYYKHKDLKNLKQKVISIPYHRNKIFSYDGGFDKRVILLGTSQSDNLAEFIAFTFKNVKRIRNNAVKKVPVKDEFKIMKYYEKEILEYKPDILIFCVTYYNINRFKDLFNKD